MTSPGTLHMALVARLGTLAHVTVYDGVVPSNVTAEATTGRVYPYVVAWGDHGGPLEEARSLEGGTDGALDWPAHVTVAAGDLNWALSAVNAVRAVLEGHRLTATSGPLRETTMTTGVVLDDKVHPYRWFAPLVFTCQTP